ncbi:MAG: hypothetical protein U0Q55_08000 [Vicinamibacterales bacterium]
MAETAPDEDLARYVFNNYGWLMTVQEARAQYTFIADAMSRTPGAARRLALLEQQIARISGEPMRTTDPEALALMRDGLEAFIKTTSARILRDHQDTVVLNHCPRCGGLARTPRAKQCRWCFHTWHGQP